MDQRNLVFGSHELTGLLIGFLGTQVLRVNRISFDRIDDRAGTLSPLLIGASETAMSIVDLAMKSRLNECTMLARAFIERAINYCYLIICDETEFKKFCQYNLQKSFRQSDRKFAAGNFAIEVKLQGVQTDNLPSDVKQALDEFTSENGREKTRWTKKSVSDRLTTIAESNKVKIAPFVFTVFNVYENASEALHGTWYGCTFHLGIHASNQPIDEAQQMRSIEMNLVLLLWGCGQVMHEIFILLGEQHDISNIIEESAKDIQKAFDVMKIASEQAKSNPAV